MFPQKLVQYFLPADLRHNKEHPRYHEFYTIASPVLAGVIFVSLIPLVLMLFDVHRYLWLYYVNAACNVATLLSMRWIGHYRFFNSLSGCITYFIIYRWVDDNGFIYSSNICIIHMFLLGAVLTDKKWGWIGIVTNVCFLSFVYYQTITNPDTAGLANMLGTPVYAFAMHLVITIFLGSFLASTIRTQERNRKEISQLQDQKISLLDEAVRKRTEQLNTMRQTIATDFHDQTGNMLAAINRQASMLELKLIDQPEILPLVKSIIHNSNELYAASKDFLWNLNHDSDNPLILFQYLTAYGQHFYNQFDISFSAHIAEELYTEQQLNPFAALNVIYIFKEAMSNVIKHSGADEVVMSLSFRNNQVIYELSDNGRWKDPEPGVSHYGLSNMERRSHNAGFKFFMSQGNTGTTITIALAATDLINVNKVNEQR